MKYIALILIIISLLIVYINHNIHFIEMHDQNNTILNTFIISRVDNQCTPENSNLIAIHYIQSGFNQWLFYLKEDRNICESDYVTLKDTFLKK